MNAQGFRDYLAKRTSKVTGRPVSAKVVSNIISRCKSVERRLNLDLDTLAVDLDGPMRRPNTRGGYGGSIPEQVQGDYLSAVRKYLDYRVASRRSSSASKS